MFKIFKEELEVNGKKLILETGKVARHISLEITHLIYIRLKITEKVGALLRMELIQIITLEL